jgi:hypothetical protein
MLVKKTSGTYLFVLVTIALLAGPASAFEQYSQNKDTTNCRECHGDFRAASYTGPNGMNWGVNLHDLHRSTMLSDDCNTCHTGSSRFPVLLASSNGGTGFAKIGCTGCHGRSQDSGSVGLRQHHYRNGVTVCEDCHGDANPANFAPVAENLPPQYYFTPDGAHPNKPTNPCNVPAGSENFAGPATALDNDGDNLYDGNDPDCATTPTPTATATQVTPTSTPTATATATGTLGPATASPTGTASATTTPTGSPTATGTSFACAGDCDEDKKVAINELIVGVNIALGSAGLNDCPSFDTSGNTKVDINELVKAVNNALNSCPKS